MKRKTAQLEKWDNMINDLRKSYNQENQSSSDRIRLLSTIAGHFTNKQLKKAFSCCDYEITQARRHAKFIGAGVTSEPTRLTRYQIPVEDFAFIVDFLYHTDNVTRLSHRMASFEGKKSLWLSDLFEHKSQPLLWLRDSKNHLYRKYREECQENGRRPISETKFRDGLKAGNFREMAQMVGLCNICDEIGARNWERRDNTINELINDISITLSHMETPQTDDEDENEPADKSEVIMVDITEKDTEYCQTNPLPKDLPVFMIHVGIAEKLNDYASNKDKAMDQILTRAKILKGHLLSKFIEQLEMQLTCPFHCMSSLLEENGACQYRTDCNVSTTYKQ